MIPMLSFIGPPGMSSDEEDDEEEGMSGGRITRRLVHEHPYRSTDVTLALHAIDDYDRQVVGRAARLDRRGNRPNKRVFPARPIPSRRSSGDNLPLCLVQGMPRNFYDWPRLNAWRDTRPNVNLEDFIKPQLEFPDCLVVPSIVHR